MADIELIAKFRVTNGEYAPHFRGPITPTESVKHITSVIDKTSIKNSDGGAFVSHFGNKQWL